MVWKNKAGADLYLAQTIDSCNLSVTCQVKHAVEFVCIGDNLFKPTSLTSYNKSSALIEKVCVIENTVMGVMNVKRCLQDFVVLWSQK